MTLKQLEEKTALPLFYIGPDIKEGPLPAVLYLALSAEESLLIDPFNQPAVYLKDSNIRVFSVDLPFHGKGFESKEALKHWAYSFAQGQDIISHLLLKLEETLSHLFDLQLIQNNQLALMGLSRGGFLINHLAIKFPQISSLVSFAPLTKISEGKDFEFLSLCPILESLDLNHFIDPLCTKKQRIYIGNRDIRVGTDSCYKWFRALVEAAYEKRIRSPHVELFIKPSIGHQGHGTLKETFEEGAAWLAKQIQP
ncbi:MAG: hypothetical protein JSS09_02955 [Verrucomicrobia bacterium]|nr:hypothetical protein [Verrucomicrobiota bacterium]